MWNKRRSSNSRFWEISNPLSGCVLVSEECFGQMLHVEQKRIERSGKCLVLMLLEFDGALPTAKRGMAIEKALLALSHSIRETDVKGWYKSRSILGVVFTEIVPAEARAVADLLLTKVRGLLATALADQARFIHLSTSIFPHDWDKKEPGTHSGPGLPVELRCDRRGRKIALGAKRFLDVAGSALALIWFSPLFAVIAIAIKLTSKGPVLFRQQRVGQYGQPFEFLKFRSMRPGNDHAIHQEFVKELIAGGAGAKDSTQQKPVYKLTNDPRITPIGHFLRRTSLDELPQFFNVLKGQMSLVGPRPPIPYEVECYEVWHRRRLLNVKPGITGLWQVKGRSRTTFDEMVRLDLRYARTWSVWMDIQILLATPRAMVSGDGAH
jgi:exopolysaccharide biosynthesis polyprenyl glycosylphosphotransferase